MTDEHEFQPQNEPWESRVERKLDSILDWQRAADLRFNDGNHSIADHSKRICRIEKAGAGILITFLLGVFGVIGTAMVWVVQHMKPIFIVGLLFLAGCTSSETRTQDASTEKKIETEKTTEYKKGVEAGQPVDVIVTKTVQKDSLTEREARLQANTTNTVNVPAIPGGAIMDVIGGALTGNWGTALMSLGTLFAGLLAGRKGTEGQMAEVSEGVSNFIKANPGQGSVLQDELSKAMSKKTKQTIRRIKP